MAEQNEQDGRDESSARPPNWPGIPGRSADHESQGPAEESDVTDAQRKLERQAGTERSDEPQRRAKTQE
jgi:hypothetical protein